MRKLFGLTTTAAAAGFVLFMAHSAFADDPLPPPSTPPPPAPLAICGNDVIDDMEQCDDGNSVSGDGCSSTCQIEPYPAGCGDGMCDTLSSEDETSCPEDCSAQARYWSCGCNCIANGTNAALCYNTNNADLCLSTAFGGTERIEFRCTDKATRRDRCDGYVRGTNTRVVGRITACDPVRL